MKLIIDPTGIAILPTAVAIALSLSPNQVEAILLGMFIKNGYPHAAMTLPTKYGVKLSRPENNRKSLIHPPIRVKSVPAMIHVLVPYFCRIPMDRKLLGTYMI